MMNDTTPEIEKTIAFKGIRKIISQRMRESLDTAAQARHGIEIDMSEILAYRKILNEQNKKVSVTAIIVKAAASALKQYNILNSTLTDNEIIIFKDINIAIAIAIENGLVTPVIRNADILGLDEINEKIADYASKAKQGTLTMRDFEGGTFTISNLGMFGLDEFTAIINPPQVGILAVGATKKRAVVLDDDRIVVKPIAHMTLTYDHRIVDGAPAAQFLKHFKETCESFSVHN